MSELELRRLLRRVHDLRMKQHWGASYDTSNDAWPKDDREWRQTPHGAPWDSNVEMARWHLAFARKLLTEGIVE